MKTLCLDLGTKTGWAVTKYGEVTDSGTFNNKSRKLHPFIAYEGFLINKGVWNGGFDSVYYEDVVRHLGVKAAHMYGGFKALTICQFFGKLHAVPVGTIKKSFTGNGRASKQMMIDEAIKRGHKPEDDNEADAIALAYYVIENQ